MRAKIAGGIDVHSVEQKIEALQQDGASGAGDDPELA